MLTFTTLASGSSGNAALVSCGNTHVLLDAGISAKRITAGLKSLGIAPEALAAVLITHEHHDHISGLQVLTKRFRLPVVTSGPTGRQLCYRVPFMDDLIRQQEPGTGIQLGDLWIESFPTPHDAAGSVGYSITGGGHRVVLCTDLGYVTDQVKQAVRGCDLLVCEANHDEDWVRSGPYPYHLKARILGGPGPSVQRGGGGNWPLWPWSLAPGRWRWPTCPPRITLPPEPGRRSAAACPPWAVTRSGTSPCGWPPGAKWGRCAR